MSFPPPTRKRPSPFLFGLLLIAGVWVTFPLWRNLTRGSGVVEETRHEVARRALEEENPPADPPPDAFVGLAQREEVVRQLDRHARNHATGYYDILNDPEAPAALRKRIQAEHDRLEALSLEHPDLREKMLTNAPPPPQINREGVLSEDLTRAFEIMRLYSEWSQLNQNHLGELQRRMHDPNLPPERRPTEEDIRNALRDSAVPHF